MAALTLKGIPDETLSRLRELAASQRRSLNQQAIYVLEQAAASEWLLRAALRLRCISRTASGFARWTAPRSFYLNAINVLAAKRRTFD